MKCLASVSYDGSKFYGFQRLNEEQSVQKELERVLTKINKSNVEIKGAGRTDRGVHAIDQKIHFELDVNIPIDHVKEAMNSLLNPYVYVNSVCEVDDDFHARFSVVKKQYDYVINMGEYNPIKEYYLYNYNRELNIDKMKEASSYLLGAHSFKAFTAGERDNYDSIIYDISFEIKDNILTISFIGKSFYRYMVRNLVGALIIVGEEKCEPKDIKTTLEKGENTINYITAPSNGLYLKEIMY